MPHVKNEEGEIRHPFKAFLFSGFLFFTNEMTWFKDQVRVLYHSLWKAFPFFSFFFFFFFVEAKSHCSMDEFSYQIENGKRVKEIILKGDDGLYIVKAKPRERSEEWNENWTLAIKKDENNERALNFRFWNKKLIFWRWVFAKK